MKLVVNPIRYTFFTLTEDRIQYPDDAVSLEHDIIGINVAEFNKLLKNFSYLFLLQFSREPRIIDENVFPAFSVVLTCVNE